MKPEITTDRTDFRDDSRSEAELAGENNRKQSLNLKVRARIGVETSTQLHAGSIQNATRSG